LTIINTIQGFHAWRKGISGSLAFVPTMGALHDGHLSLIAEANKICQNTVVSIYLNPMQFSPEEDLNTYPKNINLDIELLSKFQVAAIFLPTALEMYPQYFSSYVQEMQLSKTLEGKSRPSFFQGVVTVIVKLFNIVQPTHAFFGEKDAQQLYIIKQMIAQMNYQIILVSCPTIRDQNGLALSSRNQYLTAEEQFKASVVHKGLMHIKDALDRGQKNPIILKQAFEIILHQTPEIQIDYISIACTKTLEEITGIVEGAVLVSTAVFFKAVRLIDNFTYSSLAT